MQTEQTCELKLLKAEHFGEVAADIYSNGTDMFMTAAQLASCLEYASKNAFDSLVNRNPYVKSDEFSTTCKLHVLEGNRMVMREMRVFNEDGVYEITFLSRTEKAREFRSWVRRILKSLRSGELMLTNGAATITPEVIKSVFARIGLTLRRVV